jgi:hypothetical protein
MPTHVFFKGRPYLVLSSNETQDRAVLVLQPRGKRSFLSEEYNREECLADLIERMCPTDRRP